MTIDYETNQKQLEHRKQLLNAITRLKDCAAYELYAHLEEEYVRVVSAEDRALWTAEVRHDIRMVKAAFGALEDLLGVLDWGGVPLRDALDDDESVDV